MVRNNETLLHDCLFCSREHSKGPGACNGLYAKRFFEWNEMSCDGRQNSGQASQRCANIFPILHPCEKCYISRSRVFYVFQSCNNWATNSCNINFHRAWFGYFVVFYTKKIPQQLILINMWLLLQIVLQMTFRMSLGKMRRTWDCLFLFQLQPCEASSHKGSRSQ